MSTPLSSHFTLEELCRSAKAEALGLDNTPPPAAVEALRAGCLAILEPLRARLGVPVHSLSAYRSDAVNAAVGGVADSQHRLGEAFDLRADGIPTARLRDTIRGIGLPFDQLILEHHDPVHPFSGWVHVSHKAKGPNRGQSFDVPKRGDR